MRLGLVLVLKGRRTAEILPISISPWYGVRHLEHFSGWLGHKKNQRKMESATLLFPGRQHSPFKGIRQGLTQCEKASALKS